MALSEPKEARYSPSDVKLRPFTLPLCAVTTATNTQNDLQEINGLAHIVTAAIAHMQDEILYRNVHVYRE